MNLPRDAASDDGCRPALPSDCSRAGCGPGAGSSGGADSGRHHCEPGSSGDCVTSFRRAGESSHAFECRIDDKRVDEIRRPARLPLPADGRAGERAGGLVRAPPSRGRLGADCGHGQAGALSPRPRQRPPPVRTLRTRSPEPGRALRGRSRARRDESRPATASSVRQLGGRGSARPRSPPGSRLRLRSRRPRRLDPVRDRRRSAGPANGARTARC